MKSDRVSKVADAVADDYSFMTIDHIELSQITEFQDEFNLKEDYNKKILTIEKEDPN